MTRTIFSVALSLAGFFWGIYAALEFATLNDSAPTIVLISALYFIAAAIVATAK